MTRAEVTVLSLRLAAIYVGAQAVVLLSQVIPIIGGSLGNDTAAAAWIGMGTSGLLLGILAALLFLGAPWIGHRMLDGSAPMDIDARSEVGGLALRLAGVLFWDRALWGAWNTIFYGRLADSGLGWGSFAAALASVLMLALAGTWLFLSGPSLARHLFRSHGDPGPARAIQNVQAVAFSVIGVWILAGALSDLGRGVLRSTEIGGFPIEMLGPMPRALLGLALFFGGSGLSAFWHWIQRAGLDRPSSKET